MADALLNGRPILNWRDQARTVASLCFQIHYATLKLNSDFATRLDPLGRRRVRVDDILDLAFLHTHGKTVERTVMTNNEERYLQSQTAFLLDLKLWNANVLRLIGMYKESAKHVAQRADPNSLKIHDALVNISQLVKRLVDFLDAAGNRTSTILVNKLI